MLLKVPRQGEPGAPHHLPRQPAFPEGRRGGGPASAREGLGRWSLAGRSGGAERARPSPSAQLPAPPPQAPEPGAGLGRGTGGTRDRACTAAGPESRLAGSWASLTAGRRRTPGAASGAGETPRQPARARPSPPTPAGSPRSPEARRLPSCPHVVSKQPAAPTCPGKPRSGCLPIGSPNCSARLTHLLIGR